MKKIDPEQEKIRLKTLYTYEAEAKAQGYLFIGGVDEAGRGPFVGPVCAACVILKEDFYIPVLNDSKKIKEADREQMYDQVIDQAVAYGVAMVDAHTIDKINILNATKEAAYQAMTHMEIQPDYLLTDYLKLEKCTLPQLPLAKGDSKSASIAAASILAKVTRDRYMRQVAQEYPQYGFLKNKGYGTKEHIRALQTYGPCPLHRMTFIQKYLP